MRIVEKPTIFRRLSTDDLVGKQLLYFVPGFALDSSNDAVADLCAFVDKFGARPLGDRCR